MLRLKKRPNATSGRALSISSSQGIAKGEQLGIVKGRQEGDRQRQINMARRMLKANKPMAEICEFTELSEAEVRKL